MSHDLCEQCREWINERDDARAEVARLTKERDQARAELGKLERLIPLDCYLGDITTAENLEGVLTSIRIERDAARATIVELKKELEEQFVEFSKEFRTAMGKEGAAILSAGLKRAQAEVVCLHAQLANARAEALEIAAQKVALDWLDTTRRGGK